jgi:hypothetical protein
MIDIAVSQDKDTGEMMLHRVNCPIVRKMVDDGHPVMTMFGCEAMPDMYQRCTCLGGGKVNGGPS